MKVEHITDPGGHVGPPGSGKNIGLEDSDSGLDTTSTSSVRSNSKTSNDTAVSTDEKTKVVEFTPRKKPPFMGLALKRNPDLRPVFIFQLNLKSDQIKNDASTLISLVSSGLFM